MLPIQRYLDHAVLKPGTTQAEAEAAICLGLTYNVRSVCVRPADIALANRLCAGTETDVGVVLSFPHGVGHPRVKRLEAETYIDLGVREIDMVANYGLIGSELWDDVNADIEAVTHVTRAAGVLLKVILETSELTLDGIRRATDVAAKAGADFVKTSTGFASGGATVEAVQAMLEAADGRVKVKASGGIRDLESAERFVQMGCERLGVGSSTTPVLCGGSVTPEATTGSY